MSPTSSLPGANPASSLMAAQAAAADGHPVRDAFDRIASCYDDDFTDSLIGRLQRQAVWRHLDALFAAGDHILDLGCGTCTDAIHLARRGMQIEAVDVSRQMISEAQQKIAAEGLAGRVIPRVLAIEDLGAWDRQPGVSAQLPRTVGERQANEREKQDCLHQRAPFDGAISNFGAINCVQHLRPVALALSRLIRPEGCLALGLISRFCLWETAFYGLRGRFAKASRRWTNHGRAASSLRGAADFPVYYRSVREIIDAFQPEFRLQSHSGIGILVPPSYLETHARRVPRLTKLAARIDQSISAWPACRALADHTLLVFRRGRLP